MKLYLTIACLSLALININGQSIDECLKKDSISCIQTSLYRKAKEFFNKDSIELVNGVVLVKSGDRNARNAKQMLFDQEIDASNSVSDRQNALESFVGEEITNFLTGRSLRINFAPAIDKIGETGRAIVESIPEEVRQAVDEVVEGRGKKKLIKSLLPLLLIAKAKIGALATLAYFGIGFLAKKAIFASLLSLAFSLYIALKSMWSKGGDYTPYNSGWSAGGAGGWSAQPSNGWSSGSWDDHNSYAQNQAFNGYHP